MGLVWTEYAAFVAVLVLLTIPMGWWLARCFTSPHDSRLERWTYAAMGVDPQERMGWQRYGAVLVLSNGLLMLLGYLLLRLQGSLPLNPLQNAAQTPDLAFNTAASFITNTNWQAYAGESSLSNATQMVVITGLMFAGSAAGLAAAAGFVRGLARAGSQDIGNYWVDFVRMLWRVLLPLSLLLALVYVWQGVPQTLGTEVLAHSIDGGRTQQLLMGPVASLESIKHLGTNGGGFFGMNAAHPFENPTPLTNMLHILAMLLKRRQGWVFFGASLVIFLGFLALVWTGEQNGSSLLARAGADQQWSATQPGGNMEGKELRFGITDTALFVTATTAATTGSVNAMHDSLTPLGSITPLALMMLNCVFGGDGVGLINLLQYAILTVFLAGMMIGRTPEFLGKKIEVREMKLVMLSVLAHPACILGWTALAMLWPGAADSLNNRGPHGFSEILYAYASATANNGSAFAGLNANTPFFNTTLGLAMLMGRYLTLLPLLAVAGSMASKASVPAGAGTFPTATPLFTGLLVFVVLVVGGLTFLPALALGPVVEHLQMLAGQLYP